MIVRRHVVFFRQRLDLRRLRVVKNAVTAEARKAVVILEYDHENMIELWNAVSLMLLLGPRSRDAY